MPFPGGPLCRFLEETLRRTPEGFQRLYSCLLKKSDRDAKEHIYQILFQQGIEGSGFGNWCMIATKGVEWSKCPCYDPIS